MHYVNDFISLFFDTGEFWPRPARKTAALLLVLVTLTLGPSLLMRQAERQGEWIARPMLELLEQQIQDSLPTTTTTKP